MIDSIYRLGVIAVSAAVLVVFPNCTSPPVVVDGEVTGGGSVAREDGTRATFTFQGSSCSGTPVGRFNFIDGKNGVRVDGDITSFGKCDTPSPGCPTVPPITGFTHCPPGGYIFEFNYRSKNRFFPGDGVGGACVVDNGEGRNAPGPDEAAIGFDSGPYAGYGTKGIVNGNVQGHLCP